MSDSSSISVTVRVRPFSIREAAQLTKVEDGPCFFGGGSLASETPKITGKGIRSIIKVVDDRMLIFDPPEDNPMARFQKTLHPMGKRVKDVRFGFDRVFDETAQQQDVYEATTRGLLDSVLDGFNATVFAYGATGCGKTHTISGNPQNPGIIFLTCQELFQRIDELKEHKSVELTLSYLEIYNETIRDLLVEGGSTKTLALREDSNSAISVAGLSTHMPKNVEEVMHMIMLGNTNRTMSPTEANATSSRSHAVLQINVNQKDRVSGLSENHTAATLSIIDLAGSERASATKNRGERLFEGANINKSLLALGNCINALCDPVRSKHVPYRDSKLTRLLKFSLGGNCKTVMIVCVSPSSLHYEETHNTLKYANRAKNIKTKVTRNMINVNRHVSQYVKAIYDLKQEVEDLKRRLGDSTNEAIGKLQKQQTQREAAMKDGQRRLRAAYENSTQVRQSRIQDSKGMRNIERRIAMVTAWMSAFDAVFERTGAPPALLAIRSEAQKVLAELENHRFTLGRRLETPSADRDIDRAFEIALKNVRSVQGYTETDIANLTCEATLLKTKVERDYYRHLAEVDVDITMPLTVLTKAHFQTISALTQINVLDESAADQIRQTLQNLLKQCTDATTHIIKPNGEISVSSSSFVIPTNTATTTTIASSAAASRSSSAASGNGIRSGIPPPSSSFSDTPRKPKVLMDLASPIRGPFAQLRKISVPDMRR